MYRKTDPVKVFAIALAAAVMTALPSHKRSVNAAEDCLLFPQFAEAAAAERGELTEGETVYAFRIAELWEKLFG